MADNGQPFSIAQFDDAALQRRDVKRSPYPLFMTRAVMTEMVSTIGSIPPESGGALLRPALDLGVDTFIFDARGSRMSSASVYRPDHTALTEIIHRYLEGPKSDVRFLAGLGHSHPNGMGVPSSRVGPGLGDLGYAEACFERFEDMHAFMMPILTNTGPGRQPMLWPWVVLRQAPDEPLYADVVFVDGGSFPSYPFSLAPAPLPVSASAEPWFPMQVIDASEVAERSKTVLELSEGLMRFVGHGVAVHIELKHPWDPAVPPIVRLALSDGQISPPVPFVWAHRGRKRIEERLAELVRRSLILASTI